MDKGPTDKNRLEEGMVTDFEKDMSYGDYLHLNQILSSQHRFPVIMMRCCLLSFIKQVNYG